MKLQDAPRNVVDAHDELDVLFDWLRTHPPDHADWRDKRARYDVIRQEVKKLRSKDARKTYDRRKSSRFRNK